ASRPTARSDGVPPRSGSGRPAPRHLRCARAARGARAAGPWTGTVAFAPVSERSERTNVNAGPPRAAAEGGAHVEPGEDRVLTIPNVITGVRLLCVPVFLWLLFDQHKRAEAAFLLGALGATDFVDGYIARHFHQV